MDIKEFKKILGCRDLIDVAIDLNTTNDLALKYLNDNQIPHIDMGGGVYLLDEDDWKAYIKIKQKRN